MKGDPVIVTEGEKYEPGSTQKIVVKTTEEQTLAKGKTSKVIFPDGFSLEKHSKSYFNRYEITHDSPNRNILF